MLRLTHFLPTLRSVYLLQVRAWPAEGRLASRAVAATRTRIMRALRPMLAPSVEDKEPVHPNRPVRCPQVGPTQSLRNWLAGPGHPQLDDHQGQDGDGEDALAARDLVEEAVDLDPGGHDLTPDGQRDLLPAVEVPGRLALGVGLPGREGDEEGARAPHEVVVALRHRA